MHQSCFERFSEWSFGVASLWLHLCVYMSVHMCFLILYNVWMLINDNTYFFIQAWWCLSSCFSLENVSMQQVCDSAGIFGTAESSPCLWAVLRGGHADIPVLAFPWTVLASDLRQCLTSPSTCLAPGFPTSPLYRFTNSNLSHQSRERNELLPK